MDIENFTLIDFLIVSGAVFIAFVVIRAVTKFVFKFAFFLVVFGFIMYFLFYWRGGALNSGNEDFMLNEWKQKYCVEQKDPVKCDCIIEPIYDDIKSRYSRKEIQEFKKNKVKSIRIILASAIRKKTEIKDKLRAEGALEKWDEFMDEIKTIEFDKKMEKIYDELTE